MYFLVHALQTSDRLNVNAQTIFTDYHVKIALMEKFAIGMATVLKPNNLNYPTLQYRWKIIYILCF